MTSLTSPRPLENTPDKLGGIFMPHVLDTYPHATVSYYQVVGNLPTREGIMTRTASLTYIAPSYVEEYVALAADPIIVAMARELPASYTPDPKGEDWWYFMNGASRTYNERGGTLAQTIGGPAQGILKALAALRDAD